MAFYMVNDNNQAPSSAQIGDIIVTGGGLYRKTENGGVKLSDAEESALGFTKTGSYQKLASVYDTVVRNANARSNGSTTTTNDPTPGPAGTTNVTTDTTPDSSGGTDYSVGYDANGIGYIGGFSPWDYGTSSGGISTDTSNTVKNVLGYLILGIIGLVLLDRALGN